MSDQSELFVHIDGACRGNPGPASVGVEIKNSSHKVVKTIASSIGPTTNNVAEYFAFIVALEETAILGAKKLNVFSDSQLLVRQLGGQYRVKDAVIRLLYQHAKRLIQHFETVQITHIPREENQNADRLANQALDQIM